MTSRCNWLALLALVLCCADLRAQGVLVPAPYPYPGGGYPSGGGIGFSYQRGRLSIGGFIGGRPIGGGSLIGPGFYPGPYPSYSSTRITINNYGPAMPPPKSPRQTLAEELAGVD